MKKSSPPCRIGSVLKKRSPASAAQGQSGGQPNPRGQGVSRRLFCPSNTARTDPRGGEISPLRAARRIHHSKGDAGFLAPDWWVLCSNRAIIALVRGGRGRHRQPDRFRQRNLCKKQSGSQTKRKCCEMKLHWRPAQNGGYNKEKSPPRKLSGFLGGDFFGIFRGLFQAPWSYGCFCCCLARKARYSRYQHWGHRLSYST